MIATIVETKDLLSTVVASLVAGVGFFGAYALTFHAGIERHTKDIDFFVRPADLRPTLEVLGAAGFRTELTYPHWLGKAYDDGQFIDVIFNLGNGSAPVDDTASA